MPDVWITKCNQKCIELEIKHHKINCFKIETIVCWLSVKVNTFQLGLRIHRQGRFWIRRQSILWIHSCLTLPFTSMNFPIEYFFECFHGWLSNFLIPSVICFDSFLVFTLRIFYLFPFSLVVLSCCCLYTKKLNPFLNLLKQCFVA